MKHILLAITIIALIRITFCANILFVTLLRSPSHHIWNEALAEGLVKRGHNITLLGNEAPKFTSENYTVLKIKSSYDSFADLDMPSFARISEIQMTKGFWDFINVICNSDIKSEALQELLNYPQDMFDLIVFDMNAGQCIYPLIETFGNPPVIGVSPFGLPSYISEIMGNHIFAYAPYYSLPYSDKMTFVQRLHSIFLQNIGNLIRRYIYLPTAFNIAREVFGQNIRSFDEVERRIGLVLTNINALLDYPQPIPPNVIPVGGLHARAPKKLPDDLQNIMDNAKNGAVYFSLGTNIKSEQLQYEQRLGLMDAFAKLPCTVLAKLDDTDLKVPKNVILRKWFPQNDILGHKNLKVFFTHGGGLSTQEALYHGVPVVGIPLFADQHTNMGKIVSRNVGKRLNFFTFTGDDVYQALVEVLENPMYRNNMQVLSKKFHDQPQTPLERAIFWAEYVIKYGNVDHLSTAARDMYSYETLHLDIFAFIIASLFSTTFILCKVFSMIANEINKLKIKKLKKQ